MNKPNLLAPFTWAFLALLLLVPGLRAQEGYAPMPVQSRYLLVIDTSSAMKKRLPAVNHGLNQFFDINLLGQLHPGDSVGVWTFDQDVRTGELPLQYWQPGMTVTICSNIILFLQNYHYAHNTSFAGVMSKVNHVVANSSQLTVVIFCDGDSPISGTPVDASINQVFKQATPMMKKMREPFIIVLRSQFGKYVGFTINTANSINLPQFPAPPPEPVQVETPPPPQPQPQPVAPKPLIIIGNNVGTNPLPPQPAPQMIEKLSPPPEQTPPPAPAPVEPAPAPAPPPQTFSAPPASPAPAPQPASQPTSRPAPAPTIIEAAPTNVVAAPAEPAPPAAQTTVAYATATSTPMSRAILFAIGCGVLFVIVLGAYVFVRLTRKRHPSLITESLKKS